MLSLSDDRGLSLTPPDPSQPDKPQMDITADKKPCSLYHDPGTHGNKFSLSIARTKDPDIVLIAYPTLETMMKLPGQAATKKRAVIQIVAANVKDHTASEVKTIRAASPTGSILHFSFIEDPRPDADSNLSMLYWLETDGANPPLPPKPWDAQAKCLASCNKDREFCIAALAKTQASVTFCEGENTKCVDKCPGPTILPETAFKTPARYSLTSGNYLFTEPATLSTAPWDIQYPQRTSKGRPAIPCDPASDWPKCAEQWYGDYMKGGAAVWQRSVDFAAVWAQCPAKGTCQHYAQVVSVDTSLPLFTGTPPVTNIKWKPAMPTKMPAYNPLIYGPQLEPMRVKPSKQ
ncbi:MAG: hypothetical protein IPI64_10420 [Chloracidobacterium sp.]|nr:hypothetical protein [Chloracidobacterium sp.]